MPACIFIKQIQSRERHSKLDDYFLGYQNSWLKIYQCGVLALIFSLLVQNVVARKCNQAKFYKSINSQPRASKRAQKSATCINFANLTLLFFKRFSDLKKSVHLAILKARSSITVSELRGRKFNNFFIYTASSHEKPDNI